MTGRTAKVTAETWVDTARRALVKEGIGGVKVDRLARTLGVSRGGFYHNFRDREELLDALLHRWEQSCKFLPEADPEPELAEAAAWIDLAIERLILEDGYDHAFDMAVREWARSDQRAAWAVERSDRARIAKLEMFFAALGYDDKETPIRARVFYYHQIGYYTIGVRQSISERRRIAWLYIEILCGHEAMARARAASDRQKRTGSRG